MPKLEKRLSKLRRNPRNVSSAELIKILESLGFERRGGKGSHFGYKHPKLPEIKLIVPHQHPLRVAYVKQALTAINRLMEIEDNG